MAKRILICTPQVPFVSGGAVILVEELRNQLAARDFEVDTVNIPFKWYPKIEIIKNCISWRLLDITESLGRKVDLVICTKFPSYLVKHKNKVTWLIAQFRQAYDLFGTEYGEFTESPEDRRIRELIIQIDNKILPESKHIYTISKNVSNRLKKYNGIDSEHIYPPPKNLERYRFEKFGDYVLYTGRLDALKRVDLLVRAMRYVRKNVRCLITGPSGPEREKLETLIKHLKMEDRVQLLGFVNDTELLKLYSECLCVFYAPLDEDYGYTTVEAYFAKKPVITTLDSGGVLEFVEDNISGCVVPPDPKQIAERIEHLYADKELCRNLGDNGHSRVVNINWDTVIRKLIEE